MPVDYSKWDALELSDDSDIEVHPNVDKRSFIRAKQNQIHQERQQRKHQIETLKYERVINDGLMRRISGLLSALKAHAAVAETRNPGEVAFQAVMESAGRPEDDQPPPRPRGRAHRVGARCRRRGPAAQLVVKLAELEKRGARSRAKGTGRLQQLARGQGAPGEAKDGKKQEVELLNPNFKGGAAAGAPSASTESYGDDEEIEASPAAQLFAQIRANDYSASLSFLSKHPEILTERETDGLLVMAFDAALERKDDWSRQCVHQALLLQYCRALGKDGRRHVSSSASRQRATRAREAFYKDVTNTYARHPDAGPPDCGRAGQGAGRGRRADPLHAVERARRSRSHPPRTFRKALETGSLDKVNHVLGNMTVEAAEDVVAKLGDAGILSLEEQIIDATTEEGRKALKEMEAAQTGTGAGSESGYAPDPE
ncbi:Hsp90 co-chaperone Cdc37 [Verticillium alfalfae VaMs.102]|uniref:Hsp90 chaperone protein kinase-targeting subunit n=1 Tax=Verticillium alfalfae (strain VaMs.102 / ATCC MYA-4576 / FGSC 10136) TaxID=526221 RepID=C9SVH4_VERA1|nr:Hsp90 co-chaperone Cdc37 [Verticillium alfalfae VaMs.102]EEY22789.1 Hsp90 co-chaperone Cdc37 [Verticillium alfalfae VaMs.102]